MRSIRRRILVIAALSAAVAITISPATSSSATKLTTVIKCGSKDTIAGALGGTEPITIVVQGTCIENVVITKTT